MNFFPRISAKLSGPTHLILAFRYARCGSCRLLNLPGRSMHLASIANTNTAQPRGGAIAKEASGTPGNELKTAILFRAE